MYVIVLKLFMSTNYTKSKVKRSTNYTNLHEKVKQKLVIIREIRG